MTKEPDKSMLRWGGLTSVAGGLLFIGIFAWVIAFTFGDTLAADDLTQAAAPIETFPEIQWVRTVENSAYVAVLALWIPVYLALHRILRSASALFGSAVSVVGVGVLAAGAVPHIVTSRLSGLYHAPGATPADKASLVVTWQAVQGMFDALLVTGMLLMAIGIVATGAAMRANPLFSKTITAVCIVLGAAGLGAGTAVLIDPTSPAAALGIFALIAFHLTIGWKTYRLAKAV